MWLKNSLSELRHRDKSSLNSRLGLCESTGSRLDSLEKRKTLGNWKNWWGLSAEPTPSPRSQYGSDLNTQRSLFA